MKDRVLTLAREALGAGNRTCLSYSNAGSGKNARAQILWFIFADDATEPSAVARCVRNPVATGSLEQSHANLVRLSSIDTALFAKPLGHTEGCALEEYVSGAAMKHADLQDVFDRYLQFQRRARESDIDMEAEIRALATALLSPEECTTFLAACAPFFPAEPLPGHIQHGDLTRDNVLRTRTGIRLIDCEHAHLTTIPGYDIYNLVSRDKAENPRTWLDRYARELGFSFSEKHRVLFPALHELLEARKKSGRIRECVIQLETLLSLLP